MEERIEMSNFTWMKSLPNYFESEIPSSKYYLNSGVELDCGFEIKYIQICPCKHSLVEFKCKTPDYSLTDLKLDF